VCLELIPKEEVKFRIRFKRPHGAAAGAKQIRKIKSTPSPPNPRWAPRNCNCQTWSPPIARDALRFGWSCSTNPSSKGDLPQKRKCAASRSARMATMSASVSGFVPREQPRPPKNVQETRDARPEAPNPNGGRGWCKACGCFPGNSVLGALVDEIRNFFVARKTPAHPRPPQRSFRPSGATRSSSVFFSRGRWRPQFARRPANQFGVIGTSRKLLKTRLLCPPHSRVNEFMKRFNRRVLRQREFIGSYRAPVLPNRGNNP